MSTKEEIEAAAKRWTSWTMYDYEDSTGDYDYIGDSDILAGAFLAIRQQRERDQQPPTREMFSQCFNAKNDSLDWVEGDSFPVLFLYDDEAKLDTIAKLRAACLLLGIETEGIL